MQNILVIDDDAAIGNLEQEILEHAGYAVWRAYSGTEALLLSMVHSLREIVKELEETRRCRADQTADGTDERSDYGRISLRQTDYLCTVPRKEEPGIGGTCS